MQAEKQSTLADNRLQVEDMSARGITFLPQQFTGWIPAGEYTVIRSLVLDWRDRGQLMHSECRELRAADGNLWYIGECVYWNLIGEGGAA